MGIVQVKVIAFGHKRSRVGPTPCNMPDQRSAKVGEVKTREKLSRSAGK